MTTTADEAPAIPDLIDTSLDKLAEGSTALAAAIRLARERAENGNPPAPFNSGI